MQTSRFYPQCHGIAAAAGAANDLNPVHAAEESCRIVGTPGFYPERQVGQDYIAKFTPTVEQQLRLAGARLAGMLNQAMR